MHRIVLKILIIICAIESILSEESCTFEKDSCKCVYSSSGQGYNLVAFKDSILQSEEKSQISYLLHLCSNTKEIKDIKPLTDTCTLNSGYSLCQKSPITVENKTGIALNISGNWDESEPQIIDGGLLIKYKEKDLIKSAVKLECTPNADKNILVIDDAGDTIQVHLTLFSKHACLVTINEIRHYGFFSILVIIIITLGFSYLLIGMLVRYFLIGARGIEIIPNLEFWNKVGTSLRLGFLYVKNRCRVVPSEDTYDAI